LIHLKKSKPMATKPFLSRLMQLSWAIQRNRRSTRAKALQSAWAIIQNEDITVYFLVRRLNHNRPVKPQAAAQFSLFNPVNP
jgi:hypothetical protein